MGEYFSIQINNTPAISAACKFFWNTQQYQLRASVSGVLLILSGYYQHCNMNKLRAHSGESPGPEPLWGMGGKTSNPAGLGGAPPPAQARCLEPSIQKSK